MSLARRFFFSLIIFGLLALAAGAEVVINELYYDPTGTDTDHEFIELYNNGAVDVDLTGWQIQWGGTTYTYGTYSFPAGTIIHAGDYLLIGGSLTFTDFGVMPDLISSFNFQNGGQGVGPTDAVRILAPLGYHDTNLYDTPNTNNLEGDAGNPALPTELCIDVASGHSLGRIAAGVDNNLATDWQDQTLPNPVHQQWTPGGGTTLISALRANDSLGVPVLLDSSVVITGIVTCAAQLGASGPACLYDNTGAMAVYDAPVGSSGMAIGDSVRVTGWVGFFNGLTEIVDEPLTGLPDITIQILSTGHTVTPIVVTPTGLIEANESQLLRVNNAEFITTGLFPTSGTLLAHVGTDTFTVYVDAQTNLPGTPIPAGPCDVIGVLSQYDASSPYLAGYQLVPRFTDDIVYAGGVGPSIANTSPIPYLPDVNQSVVINSKIWDDVLITTAYVHYNPGTGYVQLQIYDDGLHNDGVAGDSIYGNSIPGFAANTTVLFYISANDNSGNTSFSPPTAPAATFSYQVHDYSVITPIATVGQLDSLGFPVNNNGLFTMEGYVNAIAQFGTSGPAYIQTSLTGGFGIGVFDPVIATAPWQLGDRVRVTGWVGFYNGLTQIVDDPNNATYNPVIQVLSTGNTLTPAWISDLDLVGESQESQLVIIKGVRFTSIGNFAGNMNYNVTSGADTTVVRIDVDTNIPGTAIPTGPVNVIGVMSQFDASSPYTSGYQLLPRFLTDLVTPDQLVMLAPDTLPIVIPATGGSFTYQIDVYNNGASSLPVNLWMPLELPNGNYYQILPTPVSVTLPAGAHIMRVKTQNIPGTAPAGVYSFRLMLGTFSTNNVISSDAFPFTKSAAGADGILVGNWDGEWLSDWITVNDNPETQVIVGLQPLTFALNQNHPNPFNPATAINYSLQTAGQVKLSVYDTAGRLVAELVNGWREAGTHEVTFNGSNLASGVYLYRLQAGDFTAMHKMVLVK
jgi:hypothetical protein